MPHIKTFALDTLKTAMDVAGQAIFEHDPQSGLISWASFGQIHEALNLPGLENIETVTDLTSLMNEADASARMAAIERAKKYHQSYVIEYCLRDIHGEQKWYEERGSFVKGNDDLKLVGFIRTIDEQKSREDKLRYLASYDQLTGFYNKARLKDLLSEKIRLQEAGGANASFIIVGVENVAAMNANYGFEVADSVLIEVARRLHSVLQSDDAVGRVSGTKFGILLDRGGSAKTRKICTTLMSIIRGQVFETGNGTVAASISIGACLMDQKTTTPEIAFAQAEAALDDAKQMGPASTSIFTEKTTMLSIRRRNTEISDAILSALNEDRIRLAYQPIVENVTDKPMNYECLIRLCQEDGSTFDATMLIAAAERLGLVHLLDRRVLELATETLAQVPDINLFVNVSWETVKDPVWAQGYLSHLQANTALAQRVTIELTETQAVDAIEASVAFVTAIKDSGCKFAIDDFGAGYTSFRNLQQLDVDILKIDGSFITNITTSHENQLFVRTLLDLSRNFGTKTVAEWVEDNAAAMLLKGLGVDYLQGFLIGKPTRTPDFLTTVSEDLLISRNNSKYVYRLNNAE